MTTCVPCKTELEVVWLVTLAWRDDQDKCQTGDSIDSKQLSITKLPGGMAPGATALFVPLPCQSLLPELTIKKVQ